MPKKIEKFEDLSLANQVILKALKGALVPKSAFEINDRIWEAKEIDGNEIPNEWSIGGRLRWMQRKGWVWFKWERKNMLRKRRRWFLTDEGKEFVGVDE